VHRDEAGLIIAKALHRDGGWLTPDEAQELLALYGVHVIEQRVVSIPSEAVAAAAELGGEIALKAIAPGLIHKADIGAVRLHLAGPEAVLSAATDMAGSVKSAIGQAPTGYLVQRMAPAGVEMLVGVVNDRQFGPTIACGAGGGLVEVMNDVSVRLSPLSRSDAASMLHDLRSFRLLEGYRGSPPCDIAALENVLLRVSAMAEEHPQIAEMDCNPVIVSATGAVVVDALIRVTDSPRTPPLGARR
jgi:acyl-CoA synthetase (NDP forming)